MELKAIGWNDYLTVMNKTNIEQALAMAIEMDIESESTTPSYKGNSNYEFQLKFIYYYKIIYV